MNYKYSLYVPVESLAKWEGFFDRHLEQGIQTGRFTLAGSDAALHGIYGEWSVDLCGNYGVDYSPYLTDSKPLPV